MVPLGSNGSIARDNVMSEQIKNLLKRISLWLSLVKFSHTVFALPFALMMVVIVGRKQTVSLLQLILLVVCVVSARTAAMAFNRVLDSEIDARNDRTKGREIPTGAVTKREGVWLVLFSIAVFLLAALLLGWHCFVLTPLVIAVLLGYSTLKRFTFLCHVVLGIALGLAPGGVWYALTASWSLAPLPLMAAVSFWVAGFDVLYSCQDREFDSTHGLSSIPVTFGYRSSLLLSALFHLLAVFFLFVSGCLFDQGYVYQVGVGIFALFIGSQHFTVRSKGLSCIDQVFFNRNGIASVVLLLFTSVSA
jgi:4-hydroxybenzoate polyprenyltransferase